MRMCSRQLHQQPCRAGGQQPLRAAAQGRWAVVQQRVPVRLPAAAARAAMLLLSLLALLTCHLGCLLLLQCQPVDHYGRQGVRQCNHQPEVCCQAGAAGGPRLAAAAAAAAPPAPAAGSGHNSSQELQRCKAPARCSRWAGASAPAATNCAASSPSCSEEAAVPAPRASSSTSTGRPVGATSAISNQAGQAEVEPRRALSCRLQPLLQGFFSQLLELRCHLLLLAPAGTGSQPRTCSGLPAGWARDCQESALCHS
jgi:hypothetical protein